jgi:ribonuclease HII
MLKPRHADDGVLEAGVDEAGRGCLWGPLVAAAVVWPAEGDWTVEIRELSTQVRDSKKLSAKRRGAMEGAIKAAAIGWGLGVVTPQEIDAVGMTRANRLAFERAVAGLPVAAGPGRLLIDGTLPLAVLPAGVAQQIVVPQADNTYLAVAAASILAKEGRDRMVAEAVAAAPVLQERYGLLSSKGYGTLVHRNAIKEHGMDAGHRRLFLRKLLGLEHTVSGDVEYDFLED